MMARRRLRKEATGRTTAIGERETKGGARQRERNRAEKPYQLPLCTTLVANMEAREKRVMTR